MHQNIYTQVQDFFEMLRHKLLKRVLAIQRQFGRANWVRFTSLGWFREPSWWGLKKKGLNGCKH
jgi:hypothetical protein